MKETIEKVRTDYRILQKNDKILFAGTGMDSWFTLEKARELVNYDLDQKIVESDGIDILWEVF